MQQRSAQFAVLTDQFRRNILVLPEHDAEHVEGIAVISIVRFEDLAVSDSDPSPQPAMAVVRRPRLWPDLLDPRRPVDRAVMVVASRVDQDIAFDTSSFYHVVHAI